MCFIHETFTHTLKKENIRNHIAIKDKKISDNKK